MLEKPGPGQDLYIQIFRAPAGSCSGAYTECSKSRTQDEICILRFSGPKQALVLGRIQNARKARIQAESVYSDFPGPGRFLVRGVYRKLEKPGPGRNLYTQIFRVQAGSCSGAYTESSKSRAQGRICILKFSGLWQVPGPGRIQDTRKNWAQAEPVYSNFPGSGRSCSGAYTESSKSQGPEQDMYTQIFRALAGT